MDYLRTTVYSEDLLRVIDLPQELRGRNLEIVVTPSETRIPDGGAKFDSSGLSNNIEDYADIDIDLPPLTDEEIARHNAIRNAPTAAGVLHPYLKPGVRVTREKMKTAWPEAAVEKYNNAHR
ncbi:MAG: hypothetical protein LBM98_03380 [Oscillospiraceae bacterium]|jgi:hypothetical protein|nr:hypothetical protein [Oscillospiraceae bacterium]